MNAREPAAMPSIAEQASDWFSLRRSGEMTPAQTLAFGEWLESDTHRVAYESVTEAWHLSGGLREHPAMLAIREAARYGTAARRPWLRRAAAATFAASVVAAGVIGLGWSPFFGAELARSTFASGVGQRSTVLLPDGSRLTLDTDSVVVAQETPYERRIDLVRGRAFFDVAKEHRRPFVVYAGQDSVTATGTAFDVRLDPAGMEVNLLRGSVMVERPASAELPPQATRMAAGERLVAHAASAWSLAPIAPADGARWLHGQVAFQGTPLGQVAAELNRYSNRKIELADAGTARTPIVGVFDTGDLDGSVQLIADERLARIASRDEHRIVLAAPEQSGDAVQK